VFEKNSASLGPGGALLLHGDVKAKISSSAFRANEANKTGGAVSAFANGTVSIEGSTFVGNVAKLLGGGAVYAQVTRPRTSARRDVLSQDSNNGSLQLNISSSTFSRNRADNYIGAGGALRIEGTKLECNVVDGVYFVMNTAYFRGGAVYVGLETKARMEDATFVANEALISGAGAIFGLVAFLSKHHDYSHCRRAGILSTRSSVW